MDTNKKVNTPEEDLNRIVESAQRMGVELDEEAARQ